MSTVLFLSFFTSLQNERENYKINNHEPQIIKHIMQKKRRRMRREVGRNQKKAKTADRRSHLHPKQPDPSKQPGGQPHTPSWSLTSRSHPDQSTGSSASQVASARVGERAWSFPPVVSSCLGVGRDRSWVPASLVLPCVLM